MVDLITPINLLKESINNVTIDENNKLIYEKLNVLLVLLENRVNGIASILCSPNILSNINSCLANIQSYVNSDISSPASGYYTNIPGQADSIVSYLAQIPFETKDEVKQSLAQIVGLYRRQNDDIIKKITNEKEELSKQVSMLSQKLTALETQIDNKESELTTLANNLKSQFATEQTQRDNEFTAQKAKINEDWRRIEKEYNDNVDTEITNYQEKFENKYTLVEQEFSRKDTAFDTTSQEIINYLNARKDEIKKIYGLVGDMVSCGEYKKYAEIEKKTSEKMFWLAFWIMSGITGLIAITIVVDLLSHTFSWLDILSRIPIAFILLLPALYLAIEARKRRNQELLLRDFEIKIANIDPYLKNIDFVETERETSGIAIPEGTKTARDLKIELAKEFFSRKEIVADTDNIVIPKDMIELVDKLMSFADKKNK